MDIIAWNIQWGGKSRLDAIESELVARSPDVIVLGEYVRGATEPLIERLSIRGWVHHSIPDPPERRGGASIVSRLPLEVRSAPQGMGEVYRYAAVGIPSANLELRGVYAPLQGDPYQEFWETLLKSLAAESDEPVLLLGDLNACTPRIDTPALSLFSARYFKRLPDVGYKDLWRAMNDADADICTWQGQTHPYRLDHAFGTATLAERVRSCIYDHSVRLAGHSDHSMLVLSVDSGDTAVV
ncbi:MAG: endonuclease/exonuclease/phosphatase family protein [Armatimonadetes bacterium]|nr:endonuclease/exonuclease/phosphatase family protein [Armatimonadota bacterium]